MQNNTWWVPNRGFKTGTVSDLWVGESADRQSTVQRAACIFTENNLHLSGRIQVKPVLVKGLLYTGVC